MRFDLCAIGARSRCQSGLKVENLEDRLLLSVSTSINTVDLVYLQSDTDPSNSEFYSLNQTQLYPYYGDSIVDATYGDLPVLPLDDSVEPIVNCPLQDEFCLPSDSELDIYGSSDLF